MRLVLALAAASLAAAVAAGCGTEDEGAAPPPGRYVATSRALTPTAHLFADPVEARVDVVVDRRRLDPDRIRLHVDFLPYRIVGGGIRRSRRDFSTFTRLRFEVTLRCLTIRCVPARLGSVLGDQEGRGERRTFRFPPARVVLDDPGRRSVRHLRRVWWPPLDSISGLSATNPEVQGSGSFTALQPGAEFRSTVTPPLEPTTTMPAALLAGLLFSGAALVLAFPATLAAREVRRRRPPPGGEPAVPPLERALRVLAWALEHGGPGARREALEALAFELDAAGDAQRARDARALAWSPAEPVPERVEALVEEVRDADRTAA